jgi:hypothetical protein
VRLPDACPAAVDPSATVFAPIATLMSYENVDEAIAIANSTRYGLAASVFGTHQDECYKVAQKLDVGMVSINDFAVFYVRSSHSLFFTIPILTFITAQVRPHVYFGNVRADSLTARICHSVERRRADMVALAGRRACAGSLRPSRSSSTAGRGWCRPRSLPHSITLCALSRSPGA